MTTAGRTQSLPPSEPAASREDVERGIAEVAGMSPVAAIAPQMRETAIVALLCGAAGWVTEWLAAPWLRPSGAAFGLPPFASIAFIVVIGLLLATLLGIVIVSSARLMSQGRLTAEAVGNVQAAVPVWWVRCLVASVFFAAIVLGIGGVVVLGTWVREGYGAASRQFSLGAGEYSAIACFMGLIAGVSVVVFRIVMKYFTSLRDVLLASDRLWLIRCSVIGAVYAVFAFGILMGFAALADPFFNATVLGSTLTAATVTATALLGAWLGFNFGRVEWQDREMDRARFRAGRPRSYLNDFKTWDIVVETSLKATTPDGYPLYMWRESADNRLGLSRPRYCCVVREGDELVFQFFDPVRARRATGAAAVGFLVGGVAAVLILADYFVFGIATTSATAPYRTPPALIVLNAGWAAAIIGGPVSGAWYIVATLLSWVRNRFASDGVLLSKPWHLLDGFRTMSAQDAGANTDAATGYGLSAVFTDGSEVILTNNSWNHRSIVNKHGDMTRAFVTERENLLPKFVETLKSEQRASRAGSSTEPLPHAAERAQDIPSSL